jgi:hypothetical protein
VSDFLRTRDADKRRPVTQEELDAMMANEPDRLPYGGAGSMAGHARRADKQYKPTDARARMSEAERKQFAAENQELKVTRADSPEGQAILAQVEENVRLDAAKHFFAAAVKKRISLDDAWGKLGQAGACPALEGIERDGDPAGVDPKIMKQAMLTFANCPLFAAYRSTDVGSAHDKVQRQIIGQMMDFMETNLVNMTLAQSWVACFNLLASLNLIPAPVQSAEQVQAAAATAERNKPASDGNPVALHEDGTPVVYVKNGQTIRYSRQMLDQLTSRGYEIVMGLQRVDPQVPRTPEGFEPNQHPKHADNGPADDGNPVEYHDDGVTPVVFEGKRMSKRMLNALDSDTYLKVFKLTRNTRAMQRPGY